MRLILHNLAPWRWLALMIGLIGLSLLARPTGFARQPSSQKLRALLVTGVQTTPEHLRQFAQSGANAVVINLSDGPSDRETRAAADRIRTAGLALYYWIEVGRAPSMAAAHPEWMASLQGHREWRRHFPDFPTPAPDEVVKNYPWVPVHYQESFEAHLQQVAELLKGRPVAEGIFLNDLQAAPSACGCGNVLCRWTPDYGPLLTATRLPSDAAARFAIAVGKMAPKSGVVPVWTTECEESDGAKAGPCAGVGCFNGACWKEYTAQLMPVAKQFERIAALLPYRAFERDLPRYGSTAAWVKHALNSFAAMPPKRGGQPIPAQRLIAVLQGWDVTPEQQNAQIRRSQEAGAAGYVLALTKIDQSWQPKILKRSRSGP